jgi:hypothetical protein
VYCTCIPPLHGLSFEGRLHFLAVYCIACQYSCVKKRCYFHGISLEKFPLRVLIYYKPQVNTYSVDATIALHGREALQFSAHSCILAAILEDKQN